MTQLTVPGPLNEANVDHYLRFDKMHTQTRQTFGLGEWRFRDFQSVESGAKIQKEFRIEAGSDLACENELIIFVITD
jgi:hypothetical protein